MEGFNPIVYNAAERGDVEELESALKAHSHLIDIPYGWIPRLAARKRHEFGWTPIYAAARKGRVSAIEMLVRFGSTAIDVPDCEGWTPMITAAHKGHLSVIETLVHLGSTAIDTPDDYGWTPLSTAVRTYQIPIVEALIRLGSAAIDIPDRRGRTPLYIALSHEYFECAQILKMLGANTNIQTEGLSDERLEELLAPIDEDETAKVRYRVYFSESLVHKLLNFPAKPLFSQRRIFRS